MNLTTIAQLFKKFAPFFLVAILLIALVSLIIFRYWLNNQTKTVPIEQPQIETRPGKVGKFNVERLNYTQETADKLPLYKLDVPENLLDKSQTVAGKLGLDNQPQGIRDATLGTGQLYSTDSATLIIYSRSLTYQKNNPSTSIINANADDLNRKAQDLLSGLELEGIIGVNPQVSYLNISGEHLEETNDINKANYISLNYPYSLSKLPLIPTETISVTFDHEGDIYGLKYQSMGKPQEIGLYPVLKLEEAAKLLIANKGSLINVENEAEDTRLFTNLGEVNIEKAYLAYYLSSTTQDILHPVWVFEGESKSKESKAHVTFVVPAIEEKYFTPTTRP